MALDTSSTYRIKAEVQGAGDLDRFGRSLRTVSNEADSAGGIVSTAFGSMQSALASLGLAVGLGEFVGFLKSVVSDVGALGELADQLGISAKALQGLQYAAGQAGVSSSELEAGVSRLSRTIGEAAGGNKDAVDLFSRLGVSFRDAEGNARSTEAVMRDVADRLRNAGTQAEKAAIAYEVFGKSGQRLIPILQGGAAGLDDFSASAERNIAAVSDYTIHKLDVLSDKFTEFFTLIRNLGADAIASFSGWLIEKLNDLETGINGIANGSAALAVNIKLKQAELIEAESDLVDAVKKFDEIGKEAFENAYGPISDYTLAVYDAKKALDALLGTFKETVGKNFAAPEGPVGTPGHSRVFSPSSPFAAKGSGGGGGSKADPEKAALAAMQQQVIAAAKLTNEESTQWEIETGRYKDFSASTKAKLLAYAREIDLQDAIQKAKDDQADADKKSADEAKKYTEEQRRTTREFAVQARYSEALAKYQADWRNGARSALHDYAESAKDVAGQVYDAVQNTFKGLEDVLVEFSTTGKASFKSFATSVISDIARILIRTQVTGPLAGLLGSLFKSIGSSATSGGLMADANGLDFGRAGGGNVSAGRPYIVGEKRPELFIPGRSGTVAPTAGGGGPVNVSVGVTVNSDGSASAKTGGDAGQGRALGDRLGGAIKAVLVDEMRPGGILSRGAS